MKPKPAKEQAPTIKQLQEAMQREKTERLQAFVSEHNDLCKKHRCSFITQVVITGKQIETRIIPFANE